VAPLGDPPESKKNAPTQEIKWQAFTFHGAATAFHRQPPVCATHDKIIRVRASMRRMTSLVTATFRLPQNPRAFTLPLPFSLRVDRFGRDFAKLATYWRELVAKKRAPAITDHFSNELLRPWNIGRHEFWPLFTCFWRLFVAKSDNPARSHYSAGGSAR